MYHVGIRSFVCSCVHAFIHSLCLQQQLRSTARRFIQLAMICNWPLAIRFYGLIDHFLRYNVAFLVMGKSPARSASHSSLDA